MTEQKNHSALLSPARAARGSGWHVGILASALMLGSLASCGGSGTDPGTDGPAAALTVPVHGEAVVLSGLQPASLRLPVATIQAVYGYSDTGARIDFAAGQDWQASGAGLVRTATSPLPDFAGYR